MQNALSEKNREILSPTRISKLKNMTDMKVKVSDLQPHFPKLTSPSMKMKKTVTVLVHCHYKPPANFYFLFKIHTVAD